MTIRRTPEDFVVEEIAAPEFASGLRLGLAPSQRAEGTRESLHAVFRLSKTSLTTPEAAAYFAKSIGVRPGVVDYAGLKDKHASTTQLVSVPMREFRADPTNSAEGRGWRAEWRGVSDRAATADAIEGNRFEIVVRDLTRERSKEMERRARVLGANARASASASDALVVINYFGEQRFGSARHGKGFAARHLVRGEFEAALKLLIATPARKDSGKTREFTRIAARAWGDWKGMLERLPRCAERAPIEALAAGKDFRAAFEALPHFTQQIAVEAYQSLLWNRTAAMLARRMACDADVEPLVVSGDYGEMVFPMASAMDSSWREVEMPVLGPETYLHEPWKSAAEAVLADEGVRREDLRVPGLRRPVFGEAMRPLVVEAAGFQMDTPEADDLGRAGRLKRRVKFRLPRGAYATVVLRALGE